jgi:hypothetical protein
LIVSSALMSPFAALTIACSRSGAVAHRRLQLVEILVLPALRAVDDDEAPAQPERERVKGSRRPLRRR